MSMTSSPTNSTIQKGLDLLKGPIVKRNNLYEVALKGL